MGGRGERLCFDHPTKDLYGSQLVHGLSPRLNLRRSRSPRLTPIRQLLSTRKALIRLRQCQYYPGMSRASSQQITSATVPEHFASVKDLLAQWKRAWNDHDAGFLAKLVSKDVDFVTVSGRWLQGRVEFHDWHSSIHRAHLRASHWTNLTYRCRPLSAALWLVHLEWRIDNEFHPARPDQTQRLGIFSWIVASQTSAFLI